MTNRGGGAAVGLCALAAGGALALTACQTESHSPSCDFQQQVAQTGTPLTLLSGARLDRVGGGFMLMGYDGGGQVRWAPVSAAGQLGTAQSFAVPAQATAGPWFAVAGNAAAGDTILVVSGVAAAATGMVDLVVSAVPANSSGAVSPAGTAVTLPDPSASGGAAVMMTSGRLGQRAGLAWSVPGSGEISVLSLGGDGRAQGPALAAKGFGMSPLISCLAPVEGKQDLAVGFLSRASEDDRNPRWSIIEVRDGGTLDASFFFSLGTERPTCPFSAASGGGYVSVWQNELGSLIGVYDGTSQNFDSRLFAGAVTFGGADAQPPLAGVGPVAGGDFAVVLARPGAAEAWRVTADGKTATDSVIMPSRVGQMGAISTVSVSGALYATYADYSSAAAVGKDGERFFVKIACF
ncbi:MAG TPA: hypothetical protein VFH68_24530 [Polyangia bacterium]|nr:hypothetical protein [Polyangia bacterium]